MKKVISSVVVSSRLDTKYPMNKKEHFTDVSQNGNNRMNCTLCFTSHTERQTGIKQYSLPVIMCRVCIKSESGRSTSSSQVVRGI